jgi:hypothetical protein
MAAAHHSSGWHGIAQEEKGKNDFSARQTMSPSAAFLADTTEILFKKPLIDESRCATDPGVHTDGGYRAISGTGASLHTTVEVDDPISIF